MASITNGVHAPTWISSEMAALFEQHLGKNWVEHHDDPQFWDRVLDIPDEEIWSVRSSLRRYLFSFIRERARRLWADDRVSAGRALAAGPLLDTNALTIGFARRFTGYKRPSLIFHDPERLARILNAPGRPVQIVFAGKAHPADDTGKHHLQGVYRRALDPAFAGRVAFVEDYDLHVAHFLVQGCDVWLNNPRKPLEASGTSGMKACMNGVPQLSIGDGWWAEGYNGRNGWLIEGQRQRQRRGRHRSGRRRRALPPARNRDRPGLLRSRRAPRPPPLGPHRQGSDPLGHADVLDAANGEGLRGADVHAGDAAACGAPLTAGFE